MDELVSKSLDELWETVRAVPAGYVTSYGAVGRSLSRPVSGYLVGRWMAAAPEGVPWWRVVTKSGGLAINKRDPHMALDQRRRLEGEGVGFVGELVDMSAHRFDGILG